MSVAVDGAIGRSTVGEDEEKETGEINQKRFHYFTIPSDSIEEVQLAFLPGGQNNNHLSQKLKYLLD